MRGLNGKRVIVTGGGSGIGHCNAAGGVFRPGQASLAVRGLDRAVLAEIRRALLAVRGHAFLHVLAHEA
jgi:NAD(P)-dependent dehydrogenase (short-subunit alcohol dehydrogenase family)